MPAKQKVDLDQFLKFNVNTFSKHFFLFKLEYICGLQSIGKTRKNSKISKNFKKVKKSSKLTFLVKILQILFYE